MPRRQPTWLSVAAVQSRQRGMLQKLFCPGTQILRYLTLDGIRPDTFPYIAGAFRYRGAKLLDGIHQVRPRLFGLALQLLQRARVALFHGPILCAGLAS